MKVYKIKVNGKSYRVELEAIEQVASKDAPVEVKKEAAPVAAAPVASGDGNKVLSPIQGTVIDVKVKVGDNVKKGQVVCVVEAMKLENDVVSSFDGVVSEVLVSKGSSISAKAPIIVVK